MSWLFLLKTVREHGGVIRTRALLDAGLRPNELARAVRDGALLRPRNGVYVLPDISPAIIEAVSHCGTLACVSAARELGLWVLDGGDERVHTWVRAEHRPTRLAVHPDATAGACCVLHRDDRIGEPSLARVSIVHCLKQILGCRGEEAFFAALESALRQRLIRAGDRALLRRSVPAGSRWLVDFARADADSGLESLLRLRLHRRGIRLACQVRIPGVGRVDFVIGDCLILEADGGTHDGPGRHSDRVRDAAAMALGFATLRFDYAMIVHDWQLVEDAIIAALRRNVHRSHAGLTW